MGTANYVVPFLIVVSLLFYDLKCSSIKSKTNDFLTQLQQENQNSGPSNRPEPKNTNLPSRTQVVQNNVPSYAQVASANNPKSSQISNNQPNSTPKQNTNPSSTSRQPQSSISNQRATPQPWPLLPANPQSILRPISSNTGGQRPVTSPDNTEEDNQHEPATNPQEDNELREFSENLLRKDVNNAMGTIKVNFQGKTTSRSTIDQAPLPLIEITNNTLKIPTITRLRALFDNYVLETKERELVTPLEKQEENLFLDEVLSTPVMRFTRNFLIEKGKIGKDPREFKDYLKQIWFSLYAREKGKLGSCGFEHVFLSEIREKTVLGLHNWLYLHDEEQKGNANYLGYLKKTEFSNKGAILSYHLSFKGLDKPVGGGFVGTSPEFEMALYTVCFAMRANRICPLKLDDKKFIIRTYSFKYGGKDHIGSAFPQG